MSNKLCNKITKTHVVAIPLKLVAYIIIIILFLDVTKNLFSNNLQEPNSNITISAYPISNIKLPQLKWSNTNIKSISNNSWHYNFSDGEALLKEADGYELISLSKSSRIRSKVRKTWWHYILSNQGGYISQFSQVERIEIQIENGNNFWWLWLLLGVILGFTIRFFHRKTNVLRFR